MFDNIVFIFTQQVEKLINMQVLQGLDVVLSDCIQVNWVLCTLLL